MKVKVAFYFTYVIHHTSVYKVSATIFSKINGVMYSGIADKIRFQYIKQRVPTPTTKHKLDKIIIELGIIKPIVCGVF